MMEPYQALLNSFCRQQEHWLGQFDLLNPRQR
jgi:hypothetical protein